MQDAERINRVRQGLAEAGLDALVVALPADVLMLTGYWPVQGMSVAVATRDGSTVLLAPREEADLARRGGQDETRLFQPDSLESLGSASDTIREPLVSTLRALGLAQATIGLETGAAHEPASYAEMYRYGALLRELIVEECPDAVLVAADEVLAELRSVKTRKELEAIRTACSIAAVAFEEGASRLLPGMRETAAAALFMAPLSIEGVGRAGVERAGGHAYCMSGPHAAQASAGYARSGNRALENRECVLIHCNSYADGYWTDVTRTYCLGEPGERMRAMYRAVFAARKAALSDLRPGVSGREIDATARSVLTDHGFGAQFKHPTGHGVGFVAMSHTARPRLHPASHDILQAGMVFSLEPAIYIEGFGGMRHCDMAVMTETGAEIITPFQGDPNALALEGNRSWI